MHVLCKRKCMPPPYLNRFQTGNFCKGTGQTVLEHIYQVVSSSAGLKSTWVAIHFQCAHCRVRLHTVGTQCKWRGFFEMGDIVTIPIHTCKTGGRKSGFDGMQCWIFASCGMESLLDSCQLQEHWFSAGEETEWCEDYPHHEKERYPDDPQMWLPNTSKAT